MALWWWRRRPFRVVVEGQSMVPTLQPGDFLIAVRAPPRRGSLAVVEHPRRPGREMVKRVLGLPGDAVEGRTLGTDQYWVVGDAPASSTDSRSIGPVVGASFRGVVRARYWPPSRAARFR